MTWKSAVEALRDQFEILSREPISERTKKIRRNLVATSIIAILVEKANVRPTKIPALGIDDIPPDVVPILVACATWYFLIAFVLHSTKEFFSSAHNVWFSNVISALSRDGANEYDAITEELNELDKRLEQGIADDGDRERFKDIKRQVESLRNVKQALDRPQSLRAAIGLHITSQAYEHFGAGILGFYAAAITGPTLFVWMRSLFA